MIVQHPKVSSQPKTRRPIIATTTETGDAQLTQNHNTRSRGQKIQIVDDDLQDEQYSPHRMAGHASGKTKHSSCC